MRERVQDIRWGVGGMFKICDEPGLPNDGGTTAGGYDEPESPHRGAC